MSKNLNNKNEIIASNLNGLFEIKNNNTYQNKFTDPIFKERVSSLAKYKSGVCIAATRGKGIYFFDNFTVNFIIWSSFCNKIFFTIYIFGNS